MYHTESANNYIGEGGSKTFYLGEQDTTIDFYSLVDTTNFYISIDTLYFETTMMQDSNAIVLDTTMTLDSAISGFMVTIDTVYFYNDSISYFFATDTSAYYIPVGGRNVYRVYSELDTVNLTTGRINATSETQVALLSTLDVTHSATRIFLGGAPKNINDGLFGFTLEGNFLPGHLPESEMTGPGANPEAWGWLADLKPSSLRFPGGASGKFMHLRPYRDVDGTTGLDPIKGYGYDIKEIIDFYDRTDIAKEVGCAGCYTYDQVKTDLFDEDTDADGSIWETCIDIIDSKYDADITSFYNKWNKQTTLPANEKPYIDQFIALVNLIELQHDYKIDVIYDVNILSSSATQSVEIVNYMRDDALNDVTSVNVVGVEMGNECYFKWLNELMYISDFTEYWNYINGLEVTLSAAVPEWMLTDHNYLEAFRAGTFIANPIKIGIPAENPGEVDDDGTVVTSDWNDALGDKVSNNSENTKFDAVIIHNYFDAQKHWQNIPQNNMCLKYPNDGFPSCGRVACTTGVSKWRYDIYDVRLRDAFNGFLGVNSDLPGNVENYLKTDYYNDYSFIKDQLHVGNLLPGLTNYGIEIWNTEKSIKDKVFFSPDIDYEDQEKTQMQNLNSIYNNSFPHGLLMFEWFLNDLKLNYKGMYGNDFLTYGHYHNFAGGSTAGMLVEADCGDFSNYVDENGVAISIDEDDYVGENYYMRRTIYWTMMLLSEITKNDLKYLPSDMEMSDLNPNVAPTVFVDLNNNKYVYIYYSTMKAGPTKLEIYPNDIEELFGGNRTFDKFIGRGIFNVKVAHNYMSSGRNSLAVASDDRSVNDCYNCSIADSHPFHIYGIQENPVDMVKSGAYPSIYTVTVPGNSYGYIKLEIKWSPVLIGKEGAYNHIKNEDVQLVPNPTSNSFSIQSEFDLFPINGQTHLKIYSLSGTLLLDKEIASGQNVDVSNLPTGLYIVKITNSIITSEITKQLVKIN